MGRVAERVRAASARGATPRAFGDMRALNPSIVDRQDQAARLLGDRSPAGFASEVPAMGALSASSFTRSTRRRLSPVVYSRAEARSMRVSASARVNSLPFDGKQHLASTWLMKAALFPTANLA